MTAFLWPLDKKKKKKTQNGNGWGGVKRQTEVFSNCGPLETGSRRRWQLAHCQDTYVVCLDLKSPSEDERQRLGCQPVALLGGTITLGVEGVVEASYDRHSRSDLEGDPGTPVSRPPSTHW